MKKIVFVEWSLLRMLSICTLVSGLTLQSPAWGYSVTADTQFIWLNSSFTSTAHGTDVPSGSIVPGAGGDASSYTGSFSSSYSDFSWTAAAVQDYGIFHAQASTQAHRDFPGKDYEAFQTFASGTFSQSLTIAAPVGVSNGSTGSLLLGWDITGSASATGSAYLAISARTSAPLANTNSYTLAIMSNGHYDLTSPISFIYGTPFQLTIDSYVQANVGYDYRDTTAPTSFSDTASANFLHTAILSSVSVNDSTGATVSGYTIITDSGLPFLPTPSPVPEPETYAMLLVGLGLMGAIARRKQ